MAFIVLVCKFNPVIFTPSWYFRYYKRFFLDFGDTHFFSAERKNWSRVDFPKITCENPLPLVLLRIHIQEQPICKIPIDGGHALLINPSCSTF